MVLDLRKLRYAWGDHLHYVFAAVPDQVPLTVVASDLNRQGLTSFVRDEMLQDPREYLFDSLGDAVAAGERQYRTVLNRPADERAT